MAFVRWSGIRPLLEPLRRHCLDGKRLRLVTTTYTNSTELRALDELEKVGAEIKVSYDTDATAALENTRFWSPLSLSKEQKHDITDPVEMERAADALPIEQIAKRWIVGTDPDAVVAEIGQYVEWGFTHLVFHAPGHDQLRFLELFERDLAPRLRALPSVVE